MHLTSTHFSPERQALLAGSGPAGGCFLSLFGPVSPFCTLDFVKGDALPRGWGPFLRQMTHELLAGASKHVLRHDV